MTSQSGSKAEVLESVNTEWERLLDVLKGTSAEEQTTGGVVGHWSVREALVHVAVWDGELLKVVERFRASGQETSYGGDEAVDSLNEAQVQEQRGLSADQVSDLLRESHDRLLGFLRGLPDEAFAAGTYTGDWINTDSAGHYKEHREDIERWKASRS